MSDALDFRPAEARRRRRGTLAPMIDVVFLLLIFFMLAARFGTDGAVALAAGGPGRGGWEGPPRLVTLAPEGPRLNGRATPLADLGPALRRLSPASDAPWLLRAEPGVPLQALIDLIDATGEAGLPPPALVE